jgi:8-oxo-dGTP pyrophosphatase MutT (NUDIX family)
MNENQKQVICKNCSSIGHQYKSCIRPITSFGVVCHYIENGNIYYLMIQRKNTLSFMEFLKGKYDSDDDIYVQSLLSSMTNSEKNMIMENTFEDLWNKTWCQQVTKYTKEFLESRALHTVLKQSGKLALFINNSVSVFKEQEWGFPKGRKKPHEKNIQCALREFSEETQFSKSDIEILNPDNPFQEIFFGTNNILYKHSYYLAKFISSNNALKFNPDCKEQIREIRAMKWLRYEEVLMHIRTYNEERIDLFKHIHKYVKKNIK